MLGPCKATTRDGKPCKAEAGPGGFCRWHDPALAAERAAWRAQGGAERSNASRASKALPKDLRDVRDAMLRVMQGLEEGTMRPQTAQAMSSVTRALVALHEAGAMERQLAALEASPEWHQIRGRILAALAPYPAARAALADALDHAG